MILWKYCLVLKIFTQNYTNVRVQKIREDALNINTVYINQNVVQLREILVKVFLQKRNAGKHSVQ